MCVAVITEKKCVGTLYAHLRKKESASEEHKAVIKTLRCTSLWGPISGLLTNDENSFIYMTDYY